MLTSIPFKIIIDSRNAAIGTSNRFSISLPETLHVDKDVVMYVNSASVTNTFCQPAQISAKRTTTFTGSND